MLCVWYVVCVLPDSSDEHLFFSTYLGSSSDLCLLIGRTGLEGQRPGHMKDSVVTVGICHPHRKRSAEAKFLNTHFLSQSSSPQVTGGG